MLGWNGWSEEEKLLQLAGYLRGKPQQEWSLITTKDHSSFNLATARLQEKLDHGVQKLEAQDFQHAVRESASDFIHCVEKMFQHTYSRENLMPDTCDTLLMGSCKRDRGWRYTIIHKLMCGSQE